jgi:hypothetical protein
MVSLVVKKNKNKKFTWYHWLILCFLVGMVTYRIGIYYLQHNYPDECLIAKFPLFEQPDGVTCGPTAAKMVLKYYGKDIDLKEIRKKAKTDIYVKGNIEIGGTCPEYEEQAIEYFGIPCQLKTMTLNEVKWYVSKNKPVLIVIRSDKNMWHWVVVIGYTKNKMICADPGGGLWRPDNDLFENAWKFTKDMEGVDCTVKCFACKGTGYYFEYLGPLGKCDLCGGGGELPDWHEIMVEWSGLQGNVGIVPRI